MWLLCILIHFLQKYKLEFCNFSHQSLAFFTLKPPTEYIFNTRSLRIKADNYHFSSECQKFTEMWSGTFVSARKQKIQTKKKTKHFDTNPAVLQKLETFITCLNSNFEIYFVLPISLDYCTFPLLNLIITLCFLIFLSSVFVLLPHLFWWVF